MGPRFSAAVARLAAAVMLAATAGSPAALAAAPCTPGGGSQRIRIDLDVPEAQAVVSVVATLSFDPTALQLPADASLRKRLTPEQKGAMITPRNTPGTLRLVAAKAAGLSSGSLADVDFDRCSGRPPVRTQDLRCTVESCAGTGGPIPDCHCTATLP